MDALLVPLKNHLNDDVKNCISIAMRILYDAEIEEDVYDHDIKDPNSQCEICVQCNDCGRWNEKHQGEK